MKWVYVAYRKGAFDDAFPEGLAGSEFEEAFFDRMRVATESYLLFAPTIREGAPVGVVLTLPGHWEHHLWPHVVWFPWASSRNKLETVVKFLNEMRREHKLIMTPSFEDKAFFVRVCQYGVLRRIGTSKEWSGGEDAMLFETRKPE